MNSRLPAFNIKDKICIICEGDEEYDYLSKLYSLKVWDERYYILFDNAHGNGNIPARYQDRYQNGIYEIILVFCDTEKKPYEQFNDIKRKINEFHGNDQSSKEVVIFANPCTMQVVLSHFSNIQLKTAAKKVNAKYIEELTGVLNYKGKEYQRTAIMQLITKDNYKEMYRRVKELPKEDTVIGSTNFDKLLDNLHSKKTNWIKDINKILEQ